MNARTLFSAAVQLRPEWKVTECRLDREGRRLTLELDFVPGSRFPVPGAGHQLLWPVHDTVEKRSCHLDFFEYCTELVARVPRVVTPEGKVVRIEVPWAWPGRGFTLLLEARAMLRCQEMPVRGRGASFGQRGHAA